jgi:transcriptional regulator of acetoin/glycerol metabolism
MRASTGRIEPLAKQLAHGLRSTGAEEYERKQREEILEALTACKGRVGGSDGAAIRLGINRTTLLYRMTKLGIYAKLYS